MSSALSLMEILGLFTLKRPTWTPLAAAQALGLSRATAYRHFSLLNSRGYISEVAGHQYALGPRIVELDRQIRLVDPLVQVAVDEMLGLTKVTGGTSLLCRLYNEKVLCIHQERGAHLPGNVSYERGRAMPLFRGATSKVILANLPIDELEVINRLATPEEIPTGMPRKGAKLYEYLAPIREERVCVAYGEVDPGRCGIAVPIFQGSRVIGSLSVVMVASEAKGRVLKRTRQLVMEAGLAIETELEEHTAAATRPALPRS